MKNKLDTRFLILISLVMLLAVSLGIFQSNMNLRSKALGEAVDILMLPDNVNLPPNGILSLTLNAKTNHIGFARVPITFDPQKIKLVSDINLASSLSIIVEKTTVDEANRTGKIILTAGLGYFDRSNSPTGVFELAKLEFTSVSTTPNDSTTVSIDTNGTQIVEMSTAILPTNPQSVTLKLNSSQSL